eukprot:CAMPEP_0202027360 /NCGR_PEP_ID=MMETSP0905-20130828/61250_1 /ASSEMBLY_ACC=CAM_ASM_000554 /TAXON_ID=420261 /ORGANISM="Thalassiosira antarctica, Strain CCMP982" /LENGTH=38 /DNA_ID= /DNA_START= /DNA_END= /DNA_ORIENTATION=
MPDVAHTDGNDGYNGKDPSIPMKGLSYGCIVRSRSRGG